MSPFDIMANVLRLPERLARVDRDLAPSGYPFTSHGHDPAVPYRDDSIAGLRERAANARWEMIGLDEHCDLRRYLTAVASQADNEAAARHRHMTAWNGRALQLRLKAAARLKDAAE